MCFLKGKHAWLAAPVLWVAWIAVITLVWATHSPDWILAHFDCENSSPVETATVTFLSFQIGLMWLVPPMAPSRKRTFFLADFSLISVIAICRKLDLHKLLVAPSHLPGATAGTPFKMKFLTNAHNPLTDRLIVAACFAIVIVVCGGTLLYFLRRLLKGLFRLHPVCWSMAFLGGTTILCQIADRLPANLRHHFGIHLNAAQSAFASVMEEGQETLLPLFVILAILQAHFIYNNDPADSAELARFREL